jgi:hypothetical protein
MMYTGFYLFGVGEVVPRSTWYEFAGAFLLLSLSQIANAAIIGVLLSYLEELNQEAGEFSQKISLVNTAMLNLKLSKKLKTEIKMFIN